MRTIKPKTHANCLFCKERFKKFKTTDQFCSAPCKLKFEAPKEVEKRHKELKQLVHGDNCFEYLQKEINKIVRLIDRGHPCISSGLPYGKFYPNAGHYYSVGSNETLRYNLMNIFNQCANDNDKNGGKGSNYGKGLIDTFGLKIFEEINSLPSVYKRIDLTKQDVQQARKEVKAILKELQMQDIIFSTDYRIEVRKKLNARIGIYK